MGRSLIQAPVTEAVIAPLCLMGFLGQDWDTEKTPMQQPGWGGGRSSCDCAVPGSPLLPRVPETEAEMGVCQWGWSERWNMKVRLQGSLEPEVRGGQT